MASTRATLLHRCALGVGLPAGLRHKTPLPRVAAGEVGAGLDAVRGQTLAFVTRYAVKRFFEQVVDDSYHAFAIALEQPAVGAKRHLHSVLGEGHREGHRRLVDTQQLVRDLCDHVAVDLRDPPDGREADPAGSLGAQIGRRSVVVPLGGKAVVARVVEQPPAGGVPGQFLEHPDVEGRRAMQERVCVRIDAERRRGASLRP